MEPFFAYLTRDARESLRIQVVFYFVILVMGNILDLLFRAHCCMSQVKAKEFKEEEILLGLFTSDAAIEKVCLHTYF
jgi:hypothetical protein